MKKTLLILLLILNFKGKSQTVSTYAGYYAGPYGSYVNNSNPLYAQFNNPNGIAINKNTGEIFILDSWNHCIRKIATNGEVSTFAGTNEDGYADGMGSNARFKLPRAIAIDATGTIYVGDTGNHRVRKITPAGEVSTLAGGYDGYVDATGSAARFSGIFGLTVDANGNVYVADQYNSCIRKITPTGVVTTLAGNQIPGYVDGEASLARFNLPSAITIDSSGNLYVTDTYNNRIRKITFGSNVVVSTVSGNGSVGSDNGIGSVASYHYPNGITVDAQNNLYVVDTSNHLIRKITPSGVASTIAGIALTSGYVNGDAATALFRYPMGLDVDTNGDLYVADMANHIIRKITFGNLTNNQFDIDSKIILYPNPVKDVLTIQNQDEISFKNYSVLDINGRVLVSQSKEIQNNQINLTSLTSGVYFLQLETDKGLITKKIIKE